MTSDEGVYPGRMPKATFTRMDQSTAEDWRWIASETRSNHGRTADQILLLLSSLASITDGFPVDQLTHCLQTASLAEAAGADDQVVAAALCHDVGKAISVPNHGPIAAEIFRPYVRDEVAWMLQVHQDFQGRHYYGLVGADPNKRDAYSDHPGYDLTAQFTDEWDQVAFDPDRETPSLEHFEPLISSVFSRPRSF